MHREEEGDVGCLEPQQFSQTMKGDPLSFAWALASSVYHWEACSILGAGWARSMDVCE